MDSNFTNDELRLELQNIKQTSFHDRRVMRQTFTSMIFFCYFFALNNEVPMTLNPRNLRRSTNFVTLREVSYAENS